MPPQDAYLSAPRALSGVKRLKESSRGLHGDLARTSQTPAVKQPNMDITY